MILPVSRNQIQHLILGNDAAALSVVADLADNAFYFRSGHSVSHANVPEDVFDAFRGDIIGGYVESAFGRR